MAKRQKVLVCGSRYYSNQEMVYHMLDAQLAKLGPTMLLIAGGARGADEWARLWAVDRKVDHEIHYARWNTEGKAAGPLRNLRMIDRKPRLVIAFFSSAHQNEGTKHMVKIALDMRVKVKRVTN